MTTALLPATEKCHYRFDGFLVDPIRRRLVRDGEAVQVTPKAFSILVILLERRGEVVDKEELIRRIWPDTHVSEANLTQNVSALRKALGDHGHRYVITVSGQGYRFGAEVEEVEATPSSRPEMPILDLPAPPVPSEEPSRGRVWIAAAALFLLAAAIAAAVWLQREPRAAPAGESRPSLAVLGFRNLSGSPSAEWIGPALAEMLTTELAAGGQLRMVSGEKVARARSSAGAMSLDPGALRRLHSILGCELLVVGSYVPLGEGEDARIRLDLRVLRIPGGDNVASLAEVGSETELFELVASTGARLRRELGLAELSPEEAQAARALQPGSNEAARLYSEGLARLRAFDTPRAVDLLGRAAEADPESAVIRSALALAWSTLGYDTKAVEQAALAVELSAQLPRPERLAIQARSYQVAGQWGKASEVYRTLWTFFPDDLEHGLNLAMSLSEGGRSFDALALLGGLRKLPPPAGEDARIDLAEAAAALRLSDPVRTLAASRRAGEKGRASGERLVVAQALRHEGAALLLQGDAPGAIRLFEQARDRFQEEGDAFGVATSLAYVGIALQKQGDLDRAESTYNEALTLVERLGNVTSLAAQLANLGILYQSQGDLKRALDFLERARALFEEIDDPLLESRVLDASSMILYQQADLSGARSRLEEALALSRRIGSRHDEASSLFSLGAILLLRGEAREASRLTREAYRLLSDKDPVLASTALAAWCETLVHRGDLAGARRHLDLALAAKTRAGERIGTGQVLGLLAGLELQAGNLAAARARNREQLRMAEQTGARPLLSSSLYEKARVDLAEGDLAAARTALESALELSTAGGEQIRAMKIRVELARLALAEGDRDRAARAAGEAASWYRQRDIPTGEALSLAVRAEALAELGRNREARDAAARIRVLTQGGEDLELAFAVAPGLARGEAAGGDSEAALRALERTAAEAARLGFVQAAGEARRAAEEIRSIR